MRKDNLFTATLTIAIVSLIANLVQYKSGRVSEHEAARTHVNDRMKAMQARANAFYTLVLGNENPMVLRHSLNDKEDELTVEFGVRVPCGREEPFFRWMKDWAADLEGERAAGLTGYSGGESGYRTFEEQGKSVGEMYEKMSFRWR